jgi:hypothetical protein
MGFFVLFALELIQNKSKKWHSAPSPGVFHPDMSGEVRWGAAKLKNTKERTCQKFRIKD